MQAVDLRDLKIGDFVEFVDLPAPIGPVTTEAEPWWFVVQTMAQQDLTTVWRLHELGLELYVPVIRKRVKTGRIGKNGHKVTRVIARAMFPGYAFLRTTGITDTRKIEDVRGVQGFMLTSTGDYVKLPHQAVMSVYKKQMEEHHDFLQQARKRRGSIWKPGDKVRIDKDGGAYADRLATVDKIDSKGRIEVLLGLIRHVLPDHMVVAA